MVDDEKGSGGLWDMAGNIAVQIGLYLKENPPQIDIVYGEDYGQEIIYNSMKELYQEYELLNSYLDNQCEVNGVRETINSLVELGANKRLLAAMKFDNDDIDIVMNELNNDEIERE